MGSLNSIDHVSPEIQEKYQQLGVDIRQSLEGASEIRLSQVYDIWDRYELGIKPRVITILQILDDVDVALVGEGGCELMKL